jgi:SGNH domain-containing protein
MPRRLRRRRARDRVRFGVTTARRTVILIGDSHAAQWFRALERVAMHERFRLIVWTKSGCPLAPGLHLYLPAIGRQYAECIDERPPPPARHAARVPDHRRAHLDLPTQPSAPRGSPATPMPTKGTIVYRDDNHLTASSRPSGAGSQARSALPGGRTHLTSRAGFSAASYGRVRRFSRHSPADRHPAGRGSSCSTSSRGAHRDDSPLGSACVVCHRLGSRLRRRARARGRRSHGGGVHDETRARRRPDVTPGRVRRGRPGSARSDCRPGSRTT